MLGRKIVLAIALVGLMKAPALAQATVLQGGPTAPSRVPMYVQGGSPVIMDSGSAGGAATPGVGLSELLLVAPGGADSPVSGQGSGPNGTNFCSYDAPITGSGGYHYLCFSPNATVGGVTGSVISSGAGGAAANIPLLLCSNGACVTPSGALVALTVGTTTIASGTGKGLLFNNAGVLGNLSSAASGVLVTDGSSNPSISSTLPSGLVAPGLIVSGSFTATGLVTNADLVNSSVTVNGTLCTLGSSCNPSGASGITIGSTTIGSGTTTRVLFDNGGVVGEYTISGTGNVAMTTSPVFTTPNLGTPSTVVLTNATGTAAALTAGTVTTNANLTGAVTSVGNATTLGSFSSASLRGALTDETGGGLAYFQGGDIGTPSAGVGTNLTGIPLSTGLTGAGTGVLAALGVNVGTAGSIVVNGGALGSPSSAGTIPAFTLGGTVAGAGNQINNVIIGTSTPLAGSFTTLSGSTSTTTPILKSAAAIQFQTNGSTFAGNITTGQQWYVGTTNVAPPATTLITVSGNTGVLPAFTQTNVPQLQVASADGARSMIGIRSFGTVAGTLAYAHAGGTAAAPAATASGNGMGLFVAYGYQTTTNAYVTSAGAGFQMVATENFTSTTAGTRIETYTTPTGTASIALAATFMPSGGFAVGTTSDPGIGKISAANGYVAGASTGLASKTCTINTANVTTGITITITGGIVTGTTTC